MILGVDTGTFVLLAMFVLFAGASIASYYLLRNLGEQLREEERRGRGR